MANDAADLAVAEIVLELLPLSTRAGEPGKKVMRPVEAMRAWMRLNDMLLVYRDEKGALTVAPFYSYRGDYAPTERSFCVRVVDPRQEATKLAEALSQGAQELANG